MLKWLKLKQFKTAIQQNDFNKILEMHAGGFNLDVQFKNGASSLDAAVQLNNKKMIAFLLEWGVSIDS